MTRTCASSSAVFELDPFEPSAGLFGASRITFDVFQVTFRLSSGRFRPLQAASGCCGHLRADLPIQYSQLSPHDPQVGQREQRRQLRRVLLAPTRYCAQNVRFSYWRSKRDHEVDLVAEVGGELIPFEVKYRAQHTGARELKGLVELCQSKRIERAYVVTKSFDDFGLMQGLAAGTQVMRVPAPLLCYWMGATELPEPNP
ncbi:MAG: ATP-binding protein [Rubrivivax sp.]|nr:ATP-binding protein [Rubrivivax sp.]